MATSKKAVNDKSSLMTLAEKIVAAFKRAPLSRFPHAVAFEVAKKAKKKITCSGMSETIFRAQASNMLEELDDKLDRVILRFEGKATPRIILDWVDDRKLEII